MFLSSISNSLDYSSLINTNFVQNLTPLQKKVAVIALTIFCAFTLGYCLFSSFFARREITQDQEESKIQQQFEEQVNLNQEKSPLKKREDEKLNVNDTKIDPKKSSIEDSQEEEISSDEEIKGSPINSVKESRLATPYRAKLALISRSGGTAGSNFDKDLEFDYINQWKLSDGSALPIQSDTILLRFGIFHPTDECVSLMQLKDSKDGRHCYLPAFLFAGKKEGEIVQLQYQGNLVNLELKQVDYSKGNSKNYPDITVKPEKFSFEILFDSILHFVSENIDNGVLGFDGSLFGKYDPLEGYTLNHGGRLYQLNSSFSFEEVDPNQFKKLKDLKGIDSKALAKDVSKFVTKTSDQEVVISCDFCGIPEEKMDLVVNEKFICLFGLNEDEPPFIFSSLKIIPWKKHFKDFSLEEMQAAIQKSKIELTAGIFRMTVPIQAKKFPTPINDNTLFQPGDPDWSGYTKDEKEDLMFADNCCAYPKLALYLSRNHPIHINKACQLINQASKQISTPPDIQPLKPSDVLKLWEQQ